MRMPGHQAADFSEMLPSGLSLKLGLMADSPAQLAALVALVRQTRHQASATALIDEKALPLSRDVDAWVLRIEQDSDSLDQVLSWLDEQNIAAVIDDVADKDHASASPQAFEARLSASVTSHQSDAQSTGLLAERLWILAASTGGPEAVAEFLSSLPASAHSAAFLYAQHIDQSALVSLLTMLRKRSPLPVRVCDQAQPLLAGHLYLVSPDHEFELNAAQRINLTGRHWNGPYRPSINQVVAKVARVFKQRAGLIVFSGMADDGAESVRLLHASGGKVFVQSSDTCAVDSMPASIEAAGCADLSGDATALAAAVGDAMTSYTEIGKVGK